MTPAVTAFRSHLPVKIAFGDGVIGELTEALAALGARSALVVVCKETERSSSVEPGNSGSRASAGSSRSGTSPARSV